MIDLIRSIDPWLETAVALAVALGLYRAGSGTWRFWRLAVGRDRRYSTSLFQALAWTIVVFTSYVALWLARLHAGSTLALGPIPQNVLTALGLSLATAVSAAGITSANVRQGRDRRTKAGDDELTVAHLVADDAGVPSLHKAQLMLWTLVSLVIYLVATADAVGRTLAATGALVLPPLPDIDTTLLVLSGIGQASYVATKVIATPDARSEPSAAAYAAPSSPASRSSSAAPSPSPSAATSAAAVGHPAAVVQPAAAAVQAALTLPRSVRVPGFTPSVNGLHFINAWPPEPDLVLALPGGSIPIGDASNGLCGGMAYAVRDVFQTPAMAPIAAATQPARGTPLFEYIVARLLDSFDVAKLGFARYYEWMLTPDADSGWPPLLARRGVAWKTIVEEWEPRIRPELDAGRLACLGLVTVLSANPADLGKNHQVLAYGYDVDAAGALTLLIYDPNTPPETADEVRITLSLLHPDQATPITANVAIDLPVRGFFLTDYTYTAPAGKVA